MLTEQPNPKTREIDQLDTLQTLEIINAEDQQVALVVKAALPQIAQAVDVVADCIENGGRLIYAGAGTSGRLGLLDAVECVPTFGTPPELVQALIAGGGKALLEAAEGAEDDRFAAVEDLKSIQFSAKDALVGIAASGHTPYVLSALEYAREIGAVTIGISCNVPAPVLDSARIGIPLPVGPEVIAGSTRMKAGTAQKMVLNMLSTAVMVKLGKVYGNLMVDVQLTNEKLVRRARQIVMQIAHISEEEAARLLTAADHQVKTAIVMQHRGVDAAEARELLNQVKGRLREVLDRP